jgi:hypothetical protein
MAAVRRRLDLRLLAIGVALVVSPVRLRADSTTDAALARIAADWQDRRSAFRTVEYELQGACSYPEGGLTDPSDREAHPLVRKSFPAKDMKFDCSARVVIDFQRRRVGWSESGPVVNIGRPEIATRLENWFYDGTATYSVLPKGERYPSDPTYKDGDQIVKQKGYAPYLFIAERAPILFAHGFIGNGNPLPNFGSAKEFVKPEHMTYKGVGTIGGQQCLIVQLKTRGQAEELWIAPALQSAVMRWRLWIGEKLACEHDISYSITPEQRWLPSTWKLVSFNFARSGVVRHSDKVDVRLVRTDGDLPDGAFAPSMTPKTLIIDAQSDDQYVVQEDGSLAPRFAVKNVGRRKWAILAGVALVLVVCVGAYVARRRKRTGTG